MDKPKIYISHSIRGREGNNATFETMAENNRKADEIGKRLAQLFPLFTFYVPGRLDKFLLENSLDPRSIVEELLGLDLAIIRQCVGVFMFMPDGYISSGMAREENYALEINKPIYYHKGDVTGLVECRSEIVFKNRNRAFWLY